MRQIEIAPDAVGYFYSARNKALLAIQRYNHGNFAIFEADTNRYLIIQEQSFYVELKKKKLLSIDYGIASKKQLFSDIKRQNIFNFFNSIYLNGFAYTTSGYKTNGLTTWASADIYRRIGDIVEITQGASPSSLENFICTAAILKAEATKAVIRELYDTFSHHGMMSKEHIATPSENAIKNAQRVIRDLEYNIRNKYDSYTSRYVDWCSYLALLNLSFECDKIVKNALIANLESKEKANAIYENKVRDLLGNTVRINGAMFYNFIK